MRIENVAIRGANIESPISPINLPNLNVWYTAEVNNSTNFGSNIPTDGGLVKTWLDISGALHDANQSVGFKQPNWQAAEQNGLGVIRFDGTSDVLSINPTGFTQGTTGATIVVVAKSRALTGTPVMTTTDFNGAKISWNGHYQVGMAGGLGTSNVTGDTTDFHIFSSIFDGTLAGNANRLKFRYDSVSQTLDFGATTVGTATNVNGNYIYFGADSTGGANFWSGDLAEYFYFTRALTIAEIESLESYLRVKWAL